MNQTLSALCLFCRHVTPESNCARVYKTGYRRVVYVDYPLAICWDCARQGKGRAPDAAQTAASVSTVSHPARRAGDMNVCR